MARNSEFTIQHAYQYSHASLGRWMLSHVWRYRRFVLTSAVCFVIAWLAYAGAQLMIGRAAAEILQPTSSGRLGWIALTILVLLSVDGITFLIGNYSAENIAAGVEADAREELFASLLGKSQSFHDRQRVGDIMARATDDTSQLSSMIVPGTTMLFETVLGIIVPLIYIGNIKLELLLIPLCFVACYLVAVRAYVRKLTPVMQQQRAQFGAMNAGLEETLAGVEVVKATARELFERAKFRRNVQLYRDLFVRQGAIEAQYLPLLMYGIAFGLTFLHAMWLRQAGQITIGQIIAAMGLMNILRFPTFISIFAFSLLQSGMASAGRILSTIQAETNVDENSAGVRRPVDGEIRFEHVSFGYGEQPVLDDISFSVGPGQTVAIVGQTGSGKSALTQLLNRSYDVTAGRVLIDGIDVRLWSLQSLRSQVAKIEQDVFLFSRTIRENIAFGAPDATFAQIEDAAHAAQAHDFIMAFSDGYDTLVGERGVTLSGGQRQRIALARAFLNNPRILILDDSTSAIDSATEDQIQKAIRRAQSGRTTVLITHRLSQIRWADLILVLDAGKIAASGTHDELLRRSTHYRRIFARYGTVLPPLEVAELSAADCEVSV